ncbi:MAG TPA: response regulator [Gemmatimonadota bacterium]|nr:response regulator [Gemmatimonadota bacterium]
MRAKGPADILLVEDNPSDVYLTQVALRGAAIESHLHVVEDGEKALSFLRRQGTYADSPRPELILLDLNLPGKDGRQLLAEIKTDESLRRIPVIVLTTSTAESDIETCYDLYCNCYITKPVDFDQFEQVVGEIERFWLSYVTLPRNLSN